jgi:hypothetical protein
VTALKERSLQDNGVIHSKNQSGEIMDERLLRGRVNGIDSDTPGFSLMILDKNK